jgi:hypothetical protein
VSTCSTRVQPAHGRAVRCAQTATVHERRAFEVGGTCPRQNPTQVFACLIAESVLEDILVADRQVSPDQYDEWLEWALLSDRLVEAFQLNLPQGALRKHLLGLLEQKKVVAA